MIKLTDGLHLMLNDLDFVDLYRHFYVDSQGVFKAEKCYGAYPNNSECRLCKKANKLMKSSDEDDQREGVKLSPKLRGVFSVLNIDTGEDNEIELTATFINAYKELILSDYFDCNYPVCLRIIKTMKAHFIDWSKSVFVVNKERYMVPLRKLNRYDTDYDFSDCKTDILFKHRYTDIINKLSTRLKEGWSTEAIVTAAKINDLSINDLKVWGSQQLKEALT